MKSSEQISFRLASQAMDEQVAALQEIVGCPEIAGVTLAMKVAKCSSPRRQRLTHETLQGLDAAA